MCPRHATYSRALALAAALSLLNPSRCRLMLDLTGPLAPDPTSSAQGAQVLGAGSPSLTSLRPTETCPICTLSLKVPHSPCGSGQLSDGYPALGLTSNPHHQPPPFLLQANFPAAWNQIPLHPSTHSCPSWLPSTSVSSSSALAGPQDGSYHPTFQPLAPPSFATSQHFSRLTYSFDKYLLNSYCIPGSDMQQRTEQSPHLRSSQSIWRERVETRNGYIENVRNAGVKREGGGRVWPSGGPAKASPGSTSKAQAMRQRPGLRE